MYKISNYLRSMLLCVSIFGCVNLLSGDSERCIFDLLAHESIFTPGKNETASESKYGCDLQWLQERERSRVRNRRRAYRRSPRRARLRQARIERHRQAAYRRYHGLKGIDERSVYKTSKGDVILDASYFRDVDSDELLVTCSSCNETVKMCDMFKHYNETAHRFFYNMQENTSKK